MKIPVSKNLSLEASDIVGCLEIPDDMANRIAESSAQCLGFKLDTCVHIKSSRLVCVSISPIADKPIQMSIPSEIERLEIFDGTTVKMLEQLNESLRLLLQCQPVFLDKDISRTPHEAAKQAVLETIAMLLRFQITEQGQ